MLTTKSHYEFTPEASTEVKNDLQDKSESVKFEVTDSGEYFINGEQVDQEILSQPIDVPLPDSNLSIAAAQDSGGVPEISHYYGDYTTYTFNTYSELTKTFRPGGNHASATGRISNSYVVRAMNTMDLFSDHYGSFRDNMALFSAAIGGVVVTWETLIGGVISGSGAVASAIAAYNDYNDCNDDLERAYNYVRNI
ncbi:hypothetical protein ACE41H_04320 [Paenibacillus enshidis]|uniref:Bacterial toxin 44 domain-containing protein n=1 Tax=Paenibacillus enshidis TaxID=1458439 RepID=A0ABV5AQ63_9BACL